MGKTTIPWTDFTFNPWRGCTQISPGCDHCYAERLANRFGRCWGNFPRLFFSDGHWNGPRTWNRAAEKAGKRYRVFCGSMCDVLEPAPDVASHRYRLANMIASHTPNLDWLLLTKRPEMAHLFEPWFWRLPNVWFGVTTENQEMADRRIPILLETPAAKQFVSIEPILEEIDLVPYLHGPGSYPCDETPIKQQWPALDWIIVGDESGPHRRPAQLDWVRSIRDQCQEAGVPLFFKQWHDGSNKISYPGLDGQQWMESPQ